MKRATKDIALELREVAGHLKDAAILVKFPDATGEYVQAAPTDTFSDWEQVVNILNRHCAAGGRPLGIVGIAVDGHVVTRPFTEYAEDADVAATLEEAAVQIAGRHPPGAASSQLVQRPDPLA